jgi:hypothetical protein
MKTFKIHCSQIGKIMGSAKKPGKLSETCQTFLKEWYAGDREEIYSKYLNKGNYVEQDNIDFMASVLGYGMLEKNETIFSDEYMIGTPDVTVPDAVADVKSPWNNKTLHDALEMNPDYDWQLRGYMRLVDRPKAILFYGLQNTPPEVNNDFEIMFDHIPENERWHGYTITRDLDIEKSIVEKVIKCREWLEEYDKFVKSRLGKLL